MRPPLRDRKFADSSLEGDGFEPSVPRHGELMKFALTPCRSEQDSNSRSPGDGELCWGALAPKRAACIKPFGLVARNMCCTMAVVSADAREPSSALTRSPKP